MIPTDSDSHFRQFAISLEHAIECYGDLSEETLLDRQRRQIESLAQNEILFRETLLAHPWGIDAYKAFVHYICDVRRNILAARPFFRERQPTFTAQISTALKDRASERLYPYHFNFQFVQFVIHSLDWPKGSELVVIAKEIARARTELVEMNMPLAISRARIFWSRTPKSQLSYMDLVQIASEGLISAVDKFCLPYSPVFRSVAIGRMLGNFIEQYSETLVHFYPVDRRKIYRANKLIHKYAVNNVVDFDKLAVEINETMDDHHKTTASEIADLLAAASCVSTDTTPSEGEGETAPVSRLAAPESTRPDCEVEDAEAAWSLAGAFSCLSPLSQKLLRMKGIGL